MHIPPELVIDPLCFEVVDAACEDILSVLEDLDDDANWSTIKTTLEAAIKKAKKGPAWVAWSKENYLIAKALAEEKARLKAEQVQEIVPEPEKLPEKKKKKPKPPKGTKKQK